MNKLVTLLKLYKAQGKKYRQLTKSPIIIVGAPRSGTTLLLSILDAHPEIQSIPIETNILLTPRTFKSVWLNRIKKSLEMLSALPGKNIKPTANRWCEKTPKNITNLEQIIKEFGSRAKIVHIIRDGRDVILSKHPLYPDHYFVKPEEWVNDVSAGLKWQSHPSVYLIRYEDIVSAYEVAIDKLCNFIGVKPSKEIYEFQKYTSIKKFNSWKDSVKAIHSTSVGKFNLPENKARIEQLKAIPNATEILKQIYPEI